ncbi:Alpha/Beta hydrolase protein [Microdochium trichocladiopsis]|uniref:Alpha/Beta hydrolase protein n=1 Tax=Microdochium trichocladiopsis TaxID=1682393 RepID=A0A9P9BLM8_9PEZI|nr:Alpha/Beta hydrolase protein [Microdochium trichocladiopsis]KAH7028763.1 Alpha/Beta hydrolase protein [Microdochium trichocladiopsis]
MDEIRKAIARHGNIWSPQTNTEMMELYEPLHAQRAPEFEATIEVEKGIKYGSDARHRVDVYRPARAPEPGVVRSALPVVVFFHGGGFTSGDTDITPSMHGNIGHFLASNGCIGILATYRLLPEARYPSGGEDVSLALRWVWDHVSQYGGDLARITAVGQSAGGAHLASALWDGHLHRAGQGVDLHLAGVVLLSPPMSYDLRLARRRANMLQYHNTDSDEYILDRTGVSVFSRYANATVDSKDNPALEPKLLLMVAELDSDEIVEANLAFVDAYRARYRRMPLFEVVAGHNHISYTLAIGLPEQDPVGRRVLAFATA